jgi:glycosyltransferase involved in cell wall biosynthesis
MLTIAIPTYNRAAFLRQALNSVITQMADLEDLVDIVVCDNASTDGTMELMHEYCSHYQYVSYIRNEENTGIDRNIHRCTTVGRGQYVHILSDDDILLPGAINKILGIIEKYQPSFLFLNGGWFEGEYTPGHKLENIFNESDDILFWDKSAFVEKLGIWATFVSSFVLHRASWQRIDKPECYFGTDIYLSYALYDVIAKSPERAKIFVGNRMVAVRGHYSGNYRMFFALAYQWRKLLLEYAPALGFDAVTMRRIQRRSTVHDTLRRAFAVRLNAVCKISWQEFKYIFKATFDHPVAWFAIYPILILPMPVLRLLKLMLNCLRGREPYSR